MTAAAPAKRPASWTNPHTLLRNFSRRSFFLTLTFALILTVGLPFLRYSYNVSNYMKDSLDIIDHFIVREMSFDVRAILEHPEEHRPLLERINIFMEYSNLVEFRIWDTDSTVVYSYIDKEVIGKRFPDNDDLQITFSSGKAKSEIEEAVKSEHEALRGYGTLVEMYVPVKEHDRLVGVVEVYRRAPEITFLDPKNLLIAVGALVLPLLIHLFFHGQFKIAAAQLIQSQVLLKSAYDALAQGAFDTIRSLTTALEMRDKETEGHSERVVALSVLIAQKLGLEQEEMARLVIGSYLHDVGKIGVPDGVLLKPGALTPEERVIIETHVRKGQDIVHEVEFLRLGEDVVLSHHEKWDGTGYSQGLAGQDIPITARIFALVDVFDALMSKRPYKPAFSYEKSRGIILEGQGKHFDPAVVEAFLSIPEAQIKDLVEEVRRSGVHHLVRQAIATVFAVDALQTEVA